MRREDRPWGPEIPASVTPDQLDRSVRRALRTLSKGNAEATARHLVMAGRLLEEDPQLAYEHAQAAVRRAGRIDVVREAAAITAYVTGRYGEALREVRTVRRLSGLDAHRPLEADCERGLGRPERALAIVAETDPRSVDKRQWVELQLVAAGARSDLGEYEAGLLALEDPILAGARTPLVRYRIDSVRADLLDALGRHEEAAAARRRSPEPRAEEDEDVIVYDLEEELTEEESGPSGPVGPGDSEMEPDGAGHDEAAALPGADTGARVGTDRPESGDPGQTGTGHVAETRPADEPARPDGEPGSDPATTPEENA